MQHTCYILSASQSECAQNRRVPRARKKNPENIVV